MLFYGPDYLFDSTASSILGLFSVGRGGGSSRFLSHVFGLVPFGETTPGDLVSFGETISGATIHLFDLAPLRRNDPWRFRLLRRNDRQRHDILSYLI